MSKNESDSKRLSEDLDHIIEERKEYLQRKYGENPPFWALSFAELPEDPEQREALMEKSLREYPEEGKQFLSEMAELPGLFKKMALAASDWPAFPEEERYKSVFGQLPRETWDFYRSVMAKDEVEGWRLLKEHEQWYSEQIEAAQEEEKKWDSHPELRSRIYMAKFQYFIKRHVLRRFIRQYMLTFTVPGELSQEEVKEIVTATVGRPPTIDKYPEDIQSTLRIILDFTKGLEADDRAPFRELKDKVMEELPSIGSRSGAESIIKRAIRTLRDECGIPLPDEPVTNVGYHIKNRDLIEKGHKVFVRNFLENRS